MTTKTEKQAAELLHHYTAGLSKGDPVALPLVATSMYHLPGDPDGSPFYGRTNNPTWDAVEGALSLLEEAPAKLFPSGMGAISAAFFALVKAGDKVLVPSDGYYNTRLLADNFLAPLGVEVVQRPTLGMADGGFEGFSVVFIETPSNPGLEVCDIAAICDAVHAAGGKVVVDNTTLTPFGQRPLDLGADVVVASDTKSPGGHSDVLVGHVASRDEDIMTRVTAWRTVSGGIPGPFEAWQLHRSLESFEVRFARMCDNAELIAPRLAAHPAVKQVRFPGLPGDPAHNLAASQQSRFGFLMSLTLADDETAERFINDCPMLVPATSFGGVHSSAERRVRWGDDVPPGFVRLSIGCEPGEALSEALIATLDRLG